METKLQNPRQPKANKQNQQPAKELTFLEHIHEIRSRLFWSVLSIVIASAVGFQFKDQLIAVVMAPLNGQKLVYLTPGGGFSFIFTLSIYFGILIAIPVIVYHIYGFMRPLLKKTSRRLVTIFMLLSVLLAAGGAAFGYFVTIPAALNFLATFAGDAVTPNLTAESYLGFVVAYVLGLALLFQLPLLLFLFDYIKPFPPGTLISSQRFVIIGATVVAAIITPTPDAFNMAIVAIPIIVIYQLGVTAIYIRHKAQRKTKVAVPVQVAPVAVSSSEADAGEPLTAIIDEINRTDVSEQTKAPKPGPTLAKQTQPAMRPSGPKVVDGFIVRSSPVATQLTVPSRPQATRLVSERTATTNARRSVDGFMIRSAAS